VKITQRRAAEVIDGMIVSFSDTNTLEPHDGSRPVAGVAQDCRVAWIQNDDAQPPQEEPVAELVVDGACSVLLDEQSPSQGAAFGVSSAAGHASIGAAVKIGRTLPRSWSNTDPYEAGLVPALIQLT